MVLKLSLIQRNVLRCMIKMGKDGLILVLDKLNDNKVKINIYTKEIQVIKMNTGNTNYDQLLILQHILKFQKNIK